MRFSPRQTIVLRANDGTEIKVIPFYFTSSGGSGLQVEFYSEDGTPIRCLNEEQGLYQLGDLHMLLFGPRSLSQSTAN